MRSPAIPALLAFLLPAGSLLCQVRTPVPPSGIESRVAARPTLFILPATSVQVDTPTIDGSLNDEVWGRAPVAGDLVQMDPRG
ncbi:MAG: hypothetical protein ABIF09_09640 [Gemmatimonadota bacterium]